MYRARSILVPIDFSDTSKAAISVALQMADRSGARIIFLHVDKTLSGDMDKLLAEAGSTGPIATTVAAHETAMRRDVQVELDRAAAVGETLRVNDHQYIVSSGNWVDVSLGLIEEHDIQLVVSATHGGEGGWKGLIQGSATETLLRKAPCSVFVVRPEGFPYLAD